MEEIEGGNTGSWNHRSARYWELVGFEVSDLLHFTVEALVDDAPNPSRRMGSPLLRNLVVNPSD